MASDVKTSVLKSSPQKKQRVGVLNRTAPIRWFAFAAICFGIAGGIVYHCVDRESIWSIAITTVDSPFDVTDVSSTLQPTLTAADVTDVEARFVADPFLLSHNGQWTVFFEVLNEGTGHGDIGCATSEDGKKWRYGRIVLDEPFHLSYPSVYVVDDEVFMVPESYESGGVRLYKAVDFPNRWSLEKTLVQGDSLADPTLFEHDGHWWMFTGKPGTHDELRLFVSDAIDGAWTEHPKSPLISRDPSRSRPAGKVIAYNGRLFRVAQDCSSRYGGAVRVFEIKSLTTSDYVEQECAATLLRAQASEWNSHGMHHIDAARLPNGRWIVCVDGHRKQFAWKH
ncbi:MAG: hypothetical protein KDB27_36400 [Planctomycetales bacterium]|nr:hypothetical protein [Planctomycetales bacterium]